MSKTYTLFDQPRRRRVKKAKDTRNAAFAAVKEREGETLGPARTAVFEVIQRYPRGVSNSEIASALGWAINRVTGRTKELRELGYVTEADRRECTVTGSVVQTWRAK